MICKSTDVLLLFAARSLRMFSYGMISVIFIQFLLTNKQLDLSEVNTLQSLVVIGDVLVSIVLTTQADVIGRKNTLILGAFVQCITGVTFAITQNYIYLVLSGVLGIISVTGAQIGPFMPIEQSILTSLVEQMTVNKAKLSANVSKIFGYYNFCGYLSQGAGSLFTGVYIALAR